jgi:ribonuclease P protein component
MLKKENRIRLKNNFDQVFKHGTSFYYKMLGVKVLSNKLDLSRLGVVVSTKVSKKAVKRNQLKRIIRDFFQDNLEKIEKGKDVIIITLPDIENKEKSEIKEVLFKAFKKMNLLND